ncbi:MAG: hypothetical protein AUJ75_00745, partial [Candidatus Omnitrophica bacterium CG1_02_49_10]
GLLHIFLSPEKIASHLGKGNFASVIKASLLGIPLPLCSCGVIPAALSLRREGASIGAVLAFLISTPTTGIDSIFATYALMGWLFTAFRIVASFATGAFAGIMANIFIKDTPPAPTAEKEACKMCGDEAEHRHPLAAKVAGALRYAFVGLLGEVAKWLLIGILIGGAISFFIPEDFFAGILGPGWVAYIVMFLVGAPMYVCATGSIPIAASMMLKGLSPGAAFVFLLSGPATNTVTITVMMKELGRKAVAIYLGSIFAASMLLAFALDRIWRAFAASSASHGMMAHSKMLPQWVEHSSAVVLLILVFYGIFRKK